MHFYFLTRGIKKDVDEWAKWMETRLFPLNFKDADGVEKVIPLQGALRPVQLWEFVAPETSKDEILNTLNFDNKHAINKYSEVALIPIRKALGAKKVTEYKKDRRFALPDFPNVHILPIGIKEDKTNITFENGKTHEFL